MVAAPKITTAALRALVDEALRQTPIVEVGDVLTLYEAEFGGCPPQNRVDRLYALITQSLCVQGKGERAMPVLRRLQRSVLFEGALGLLAEPYAALLNVLADASRDGVLRPLDDKAEWIAAVIASAAAQVLSSLPATTSAREKAVMGAAQRLSGAGAVLAVEEGRYHVDAAELARLSSSIDAMAAALGGLCVLHQVCGWLHETVPLDFGRYPLGRRFAAEASFPVGYMLQLGVKHLSSPPAAPKRRPALWADLTKQAIDLAAVIDVEPHSDIEDVVISKDDVPRYLASVSLFDHLFALRQWPPSRARNLLSGVTSLLDAAEMRSLVGWDMADVLLLLDAVLKLGTAPCKIIKAPDIHGAGVPAAVWDKLAPHFVHALGAVNRSYVSPLDAGKAEFDFKPLFALPKDHFLIVTPGLAGIGFFEAVTRALRGAGYPNLDGLLADAIEIVAQDAFRAVGLNVTVAGKEYSETGSPSEDALGECDAVVETSNVVTFVELKKKPLRRISGGGDAAAALVDLNASLFAAQGQLARHEARLLRCDELRFKNGYVLELKGRTIERVAMTWLDYGSPQDKYLLHQVFEVLLGARLNTDHPKEGKKLKELNEAIEDLEKEVSELIALGKDQRPLFMNCWFLSTPQLMLLLDGVAGDSDFEARLRTLAHLTYRTLDFYREVSIARETRLIS